MSSSEDNCTVPVTQTPDTQILCDTVLELASRSVTRIAPARKIAQALDCVMHLMNPAQKQIARGLIQGMEAKWGPMLPGASSTQHATEQNTQKIAPEHTIAVWLARRKTPERMMRVLASAANCIGEEPQRLGYVMDKAFGKETDHVLIPVGYDQFKQWMIELRIGKPVREGGKVWWHEGEWNSLWRKVCTQLSHKETVQAKVPSMQHPSVGAKKAAVVPGTKQKVEEASGLPLIRAELRKIQRDRAAHRTKMQKRAGKRWAARKKALVSGV